MSSQFFTKGLPFVSHNARTNEHNGSSLFTAGLAKQRLFQPSSVNFWAFGNILT